MDVRAKASSNWKLSGGCEIDNAVQMKILKEEIFVKPELDEIINERYAVLLSSPNKREQQKSCKLQLSVFPRYTIEALTILCSAPKLEVFLGFQMEYVETVYGIIISDDGDKGGQPMPSYRYDIEVHKCGIIELTLKLLTPLDEVCIYGVLLQIAPNTNGITTLLPGVINLDNVQQMLESSNLKLSPNAEKCKMFVEMFKKSASQNALPQSHAASTSEPTPLSILEQMKQVLISSATEENTNMALPPTLDLILKSHIDIRLHELEMRINKRFDAFETQQNANINRILQILDRNNKELNT